MELIGFNNSRLTSLFFASAKHGQPYRPKMLHAVVEKYKFVGFPTKIDELMNDRVSFKHGMFGNAAIETFDVYNDGVVVSSQSNTSLLDEFLEDVLEWAAKEFDYQVIRTHEINKMYESDLIIRSEKNILHHLDALKPIQSLISQFLKKATGRDTVFYPFGMSIAADNALITGMKPPPFRLERKIDLAHSANYYVSTAPLRTNDHMRVLQALEDLASGTPDAKERRPKG